MIHISVLEKAMDLKFKIMPITCKIQVHVFEILILKIFKGIFLIC